MGGWNILVVGNRVDSQNGHILRLLIAATTTLSVLVAVLAHVVDAPHTRTVNKGLDTKF